MQNRGPEEAIYAELPRQWAINQVRMMYSAARIVRFRIVHLFLSYKLSQRVAQYGTAPVYNILNIIHIIHISV